MSDTWGIFTKHGQHVHGFDRASESAAMVAFCIAKDEGQKWWKEQTNYVCKRVRP